MVPTHRGRLDPVRFVLSAFAGVAAVVAALSVLGSGCHPPGRNSWKHVGPDAGGPAVERTYTLQSSQSLPAQPFAGAVVLRGGADAGTGTSTVIEGVTAAGPAGPIPVQPETNSSVQSALAGLLMPAANDQIVFFRTASSVAASSGDTFTFTIAFNQEFSGTLNSAGVEENNPSQASPVFSDDPVPESTPVPALPGWAAAMFAAMLAGLAARALRRGRATSAH